MNKRTNDNDTRLNGKKIHACDNVRINGLSCYYHNQKNPWSSMPLWAWCRWFMLIRLRLFGRSTEFYSSLWIPIPGQNKRQTEKRKGKQKLEKFETLFEADHRNQKRKKLKSTTNMQHKCKRQSQRKTDTLLLLTDAEKKWESPSNHSKKNNKHSARQQKRLSSL